MSSNVIDRSPRIPASSNVVVAIHSPIVRPGAGATPGVGPSYLGGTSALVSVSCGLWDDRRRMYLPPSQLAFELVDPARPGRPLDAVDSESNRPRVNAADAVAFYSTRLDLPRADDGPLPLVVRFRCRFDRPGATPIREAREAPIVVHPRGGTAGAWRPFLAPFGPSRCTVTAPAADPVPSFAGKAKIAIEGQSEGRPKDAYLQLILVDRSSSCIIDDQAGSGWVPRPGSSFHDFKAELTVPDLALLGDDADDLLMFGYVRRLVGGEILENVLAPRVRLRR